MSLLDKLRAKRAVDTATEAEPAVQEDPAPAIIDECPPLGTEGDEVSESLFFELNQIRTTAPEIIAAAKPYIPSVLAIVKAHLRQIYAYTERTPDKDASVRIFNSPNHMYAFIYCLAPIGAGMGISEELVADAIGKYKIAYGIDTDCVTQMIRTKSYHRIYILAKGQLSVPGEDGRVADHFPRSQDIHLKEDEHGIIDYKDLSLFQAVEAGQVICDLTPPTAGVKGIDVFGHPAPARKGKMPPVPNGKNTSISKDGRSLVADISGDLSFANGCFRVSPQLTIRGNVDNSTGNIEFLGDVLVMGDVQQGFRITAGGNIIVQGMCESSTLTAGEDITLRKGMNGHGGGLMTAKGSVHSRFLEQTTVIAGEDVRAEAIVNCTITAGGNIDVTIGKGAIIGGSLSAGKNISARKIGNLANIHTLLQFGVTPDYAEKIEKVQNELEKAHATLDTLKKNYRFMSGSPSLSPAQKEVLHTLDTQAKIYTKQVQELENELKILQNPTTDYSGLSVRSDIIYGITEVCLDNYKLFIRDTSSRCTIYFSDGDLHMGLF